MMFTSSHLNSRDDLVTRQNMVNFQCRGRGQLMLKLAGGEKTRKECGVADVAMLSFYWIQCLSCFAQKKLF